MMYYIVSVLFLLFVWCPCIAINVSVQYNGGLLPDILLLNPFQYHVEALSLQPMKQYIITTMFDDVLHCFRFVFAFLKKDQNAPRPSEHLPVRGGKCQNV